MRWLSVAILNTLNSHWHIWTFQAIDLIHQLHLLLWKDLCWSTSYYLGSVFSQIPQIMNYESYLIVASFCKMEISSMLVTLREYPLFHKTRSQKSGFQRCQQCPFLKSVTFSGLNPEMNLSWIWLVFYDLLMINGELVLC